MKKLSLQVQKTAAKQRLAELHPAMLAKLLTVSLTKKDGQHLVALLLRL